MNWRVVDRYAGTTLLAMIFLFCTGYGVYVSITTELWTHWYFLVCFIPIWMVVTASLLGEVGLDSLRVIIRIGRSYLMRCWSIVREMWMSLTNYTMH